MIEFLAWCALVLAALPAAVAAMNLFFYRRPRPAPALVGDGARPAAISILIPARDEAAQIGGALHAVLASTGVDLEVVVLDDHSSDRTAEIVRAVAAADPRVRLAMAPPLPTGWSGKQHACHRLASLACHELMLFVDADVRFAPDGLARVAAFLQAHPAVALASGFPHQVTRTLAEKLVVPMILFLLLGYLPMPGLRWTVWPAFGAACGQLIAVRRAAYERAGGHAAIRSSLHDGLSLPRAFRRCGLRTDVFDATDVASCRMYEGARAVWAGFSKNATEGMATPAALPVWTVLLFGGHVLPFLLVAAAVLLDLPPGVLLLAFLATGLSLGLRLALALRFRQSWLGAVLHPLGVLATLAIQISALVRALRGAPPVWRGRSYRCTE